MSISFKQFEDLTIRVLTEMQRVSRPAIDAVMMIVAHESNGGEYLRQIKGPALGVIQMEPVTHDSLWAQADMIKENATKLGIVQNCAALEWDLRYNIFMSRSMLLVDKKPIPESHRNLSIYLKEMYNTNLGAAEDDDYLLAYQAWKIR